MPDDGKCLAGTGIAAVMGSKDAAIRSLHIENANHLLISLRSPGILVERHSDVGWRKGWLPYRAHPELFVHKARRGG